MHVINEQLHGSYTLVDVLYGSDSSHAASLRHAEQTARESKMAPFNAAIAQIYPVVTGVLKTMKADVESGFAGNLQRQAVGEVVADFLTLAKEALNERTENGKNVAAVLTAAAFEDTIRKLGELKAAVHDRRPLSEVLIELKRANVLTGATFTTAQGYLKFRNDSLHADFSNVQDALVASCLAFVEHLIFAHFA